MLGSVCLNRGRLGRVGIEVSHLVGQLSVIEFRTNKSTGQD